MARRTAARHHAIAVLIMGLIAMLGHLQQVSAEDGYALWLRYVPLPEASAAVVRRASRVLVLGRDDPMVQVASEELRRALSGLTGQPPRPSLQWQSTGTLWLGAASDLPEVLKSQVPSMESIPGSYRLRTLSYRGRNLTAIVGSDSLGVLYGSYHWLRLVQTGARLDSLDVQESPRVRRRVLNHWDNLDGSVERGYAGGSLWNWFTLPWDLSPRYIDYARACASIGINGAVINNVNADALILSHQYLLKAAVLAKVFRPYGVRVYLSVPFDAPMVLGRLPTADTEDAAVQAWWRGKADEIYGLIPDFGGFLIKANSEGQPGPRTYGHAPTEGANKIADALAPHGGVVMWRAFVYSDSSDADRAMDAYREFRSLDGQFAPNVLLQIKNGPIDFQPREPFHPLFGSLPHTSVAMEVQITKEYLGFSTHLVYLGPLYEEVLQADTFTRGPGSRVADVIDGRLFGPSETAMAGVANIGDARNWTGSTFDQANWYAFGRLAWNPNESSRDIAADWVRMTLSSDQSVVETVVRLMMESREAAVNYMTPLGLHHQMSSTHYGPGPWVTSSPQTPSTSVYFNRADMGGIGFDRTAKGSAALSQYAPAIEAEWGSPMTVPERYLLWFHHLPWDYRMPSGRTLWDTLALRYQEGVMQVEAMQRVWLGLQGHVDAERFVEVRDHLERQAAEAVWWRDASLAFFQSLSKRPLPAGVPAPALTLEEYESECTPYVPGASRPRHPECVPLQ